MMEIPPVTFIRAALIVLLSSWGPAQAEPSNETPPSVSAFFILGDSSVNCGDNTVFYPLLGANFSAYLCNAGRRKLLPDHLSQRMGLPAVPPFYGQNKTVEGLMGGLNFGSSPATIISDGWWGFGGLNQQARQLFETMQLLQLQLGQEPARRVVDSALFYLSFGKDDFIQFFGNDSAMRHTFSGRSFARFLAHQMIRVVKDLMNAGARRIVCAGVEPLGCAPRSRWRAFSASNRSPRGCVEKMNGVIATYNRMLAAGLYQLNSHAPGTKLIFCDVYQGMTEMITDPLNYGFEQAERACCGVGRFGGMIGCLTKMMACADERRRVWWDLYSPTEAVNELLAQWAWSGIPLNICHPLPLQQVVAFN